MQIYQSCDPHLHFCNMKVKLEIPKQAMARSRSLPRSASDIAEPPSPFSSNPAHHPVSMPTTPATATGLSSSVSFGCIAAKPTTDSPPAKPKPLTPAAAAAAYYASLWSPRRLMQRAARAFRTNRSRRVRAKDAGEERAGGSVTGKVSDAASPVSLGAAATELAGSDGHGGAAAGVQEEEQHHNHPEAVPEKIIHEANHHAPPPVVAENECGTKTTPAEEKETAADDAVEEVESPKKGAALMTPAPAPEAADAATEDVADKFVTVVKEAIKKHEAEQGGEKKEAMRRFQGSRVRTAMEARPPESEQPRRREVARSNDVIEEARSKLLEKRQFSRVRALVGAFETVMDDVKKDAAGTPKHDYCKSA